MEFLNKNKLVLSFGEIVWDIFPNEKKLGGAPLNFAYYINKLGGCSHVISAVGNDDLGYEALRIINACGVKADAIKTSESLPTGKVVVSEDKSGLPSYNICSPAAWDEITLSANDFDLAKKADAFVFGTLSQRTKNNINALRKITSKLNSEAIVVFDANIRQNFYSREIIHESMKIADVVKMNEDEYPIITGFYGYSHDAPLEKNIRDLMSEFQIKYLLLTLGKNGSIVFDACGEVSRHLGHQIKVVDTVGAGDSFTAAFTWGILCGKSLEESAAAATELSEKVCGQRGAFCL